MRIKEVTLKLEVGTQAKPYHPVRVSAELTMSLDKNDILDNAFDILKATLEEKVFSVLETEVNRVKELVIAKEQLNIENKEV